MRICEYATKQIRPYFGAYSDIRFAYRTDASSASRWAPHIRTFAYLLMIEFKNLKKSFGPQRVRTGVALVVAEGETLALLGPSGTGKSVLLKHAIGLLRPDRGQVIVDGKEVRKLNRHDLRDLRETIGYVFQNGALFDSQSVYEN